MSGRLIMFQVEGVPVGQPRQRMGRAFGTGFLKAYTPKSHPVVPFKQAVVLAARQATGFPRGELWDGPLVVRLLAVFRRSKRLPQGGQRSWYVSKPDSDNLAKSLLDALSGQLFVDDDQVVDLRVCKCYAATGESPHLEVEVEELDMPAAVYLAGRT